MKGKNKNKKNKKNKKINPNQIPIPLKLSLSNIIFLNASTQPHPQTHPPLPNSLLQAPHPLNQNHAHVLLVDIIDDPIISIQEHKIVGNNNRIEKDKGEKIGKGKGKGKGKGRN